MTDSKKVPAGYERVNQLAEEFFSDTAELAGHVEKVQKARRKAAKPLMPKLQRLAARTLARKEALRAEVAAHPELWAKPRTRELGGVKVGFRNLPDSIDINAESAIPLIREKLPGQAKLLIVKTEKLNMKAVKALEATQLSKIGGVVVAGGEAVVAAIAKSDVDKLVEALTEDAGDPDEETGEEE